MHTRLARTGKPSPLEVPEITVFTTQVGERTPKLRVLDIFRNALSEDALLHEILMGS